MVAVATNEYHKSSSAFPIPQAVPDPVAFVLYPYDKTQAVEDVKVTALAQFSFGIVQLMIT